MSFPVHGQSCDKQGPAPVGRERHEVALLKEHCPSEVPLEVPCPSALPSDSQHPSGLPVEQQHPSGLSGAGCHQSALPVEGPGLSIRGHPSDMDVEFSNLQSSLLVCMCHGN